MEEPGYGLLHGGGDAQLRFRLEWAPGRPRSEVLPSGPEDLNNFPPLCFALCSGLATEHI